jgi:hypothetical protein
VLTPIDRAGGDGATRRPALVPFRAAAAAGFMVEGVTRSRSQQDCPLFWRVRASGVVGMYPAR